MPDFSAYLGRQTPDGQPIEDTVSLCQYLLQEGRVAAVPGEAFGAPGTIRFSYATSNDIIKQVIHQVASTLAKLTR
jgi:aspartate/methionine/tyrosine aminotransferase